MLPEKKPETTEEQQPSETPRSAHIVGDVNVLDLKNRVDRLTSSVEGLTEQLDLISKEFIPTPEEVTDLTTHENDRLNSIEQNVLEIKQALFDGKKVENREPQEKKPETTEKETSKEASNNPAIEIDMGKDTKKPMYKQVRKRGGRIVTRLVKG